MPVSRLSDSIYAKGSQQTECGSSSEAEQREAVVIVFAEVSMRSSLSFTSPDTAFFSTSGMDFCPEATAAQDKTMNFLILPVS